MTAKWKTLSVVIAVVALCTAVVAHAEQTAQCFACIDGQMNGLDAHLDYWDFVNAYHGGQGMHYAEAYGHCNNAHDPYSQAS